jgi:DNA-binding Lrp family transcriptional regulator
VSVKSTVASHASQGVGPIAVCAAGSVLTRRASGTLRPYGALPHDLTADPGLSPTDVRVAAALLFWAREKALCWPCDRSIAERVGRSIGTVQRSLRRLEAAGWIVREKTSTNRTGRLIRLLWRSPSARPLPSPALDPPPSLARDEVETSEREASNIEPAAADPIVDRLKTEGLPEPLAERFAREAPEASTRMLLNVEVRRVEGKLKNPAGYLRAGIEGNYALLPAAAKRVEAERRAEQTAMRNAQAALAKAQAVAEHGAEDARVNRTLAALSPDRLAELVSRAVAELPAPIVRRNPTIANPFIRAKVFELATG